MMLAVAPTDWAIALISREGPVMRDVPESTMPFVWPEEWDPTEMSSMSISQYLGSERGTHVISPVNFESSYPPKVSSPSSLSPRSKAKTDWATTPWSLLKNPWTSPEPYWMWKS